MKFVSVAALALVALVQAEPAPRPDLGDSIGGFITSDLVPGVSSLAGEVKSTLAADASRVGSFVSSVANQAHSTLAADASRAGALASSLAAKPSQAIASLASKPAAEIASLTSAAASRFSSLSSVAATAEGAAKASAASDLSALSASLASKTSSIAAAAASALTAQHTTPAPGQATQTKEGAGAAGPTAVVALGALMGGAALFANL